MDGTRIQDRIYYGFSKVAARTGLIYDVYRSSTNMQPIASGNHIAKLPATFAADVKFSVPNKYLSPTWFCYADGRVLQQFDILVGTFGTFYIADKQPNLPMQAIKTTHTVSLGTPVYSTSGPVEEITVVYATGIPVFMQFKREEIKNATFANSLGQSITQWSAFIPLPPGTIKQSDLMVDEDGIRYVVDAPEFTEIGYAARVRLATI